MDDIIKEFLVESYENLDRLDVEFVELEKKPGDRELLSSIFRVIHTIKGTCGFLDFHHLEKVTHAGESLLSQLRDGLLTLDKNIVSVLLSMIDAVRAMLAEIEKNGRDGEEAYSDLIQRLIACSENQSSTVAAPLDMIEIQEPTPADVIEDDLVVAQEESVNNEHVPSTIQDTSIRVNIELLDNLMNLVGELVLSRNQIIQYSKKYKDGNFIVSTQRLNLITSELQEKLMRTRLQPISNIWNKFPRVVRDLSNGLNKQVKLEMRGEDTEIDKSIIEAIKDPLTHIIRNAVDHGLELESVRLARGKKAVGTIQLQAYHESGEVIIEINDDGNGIDLDAVKAKAEKLGWFNRVQLQQMSEREIVNLILMPGFSTAAQVTAISGRGVGMDVVKTQIEKIGGFLDINSVFGLGFSIKIKIPLTLSIIPALIIESNQAEYAIPQVNVVELLVVDNENNGKVEWVYQLPVYRLRGKLLPLISLEQILTASQPESFVEQLQKSISIVVLQAGAQQFGLVVDGIKDTQDIVVKSLTKTIRDIGIYLGATIMGEGQVALILDALGLAEKSKLFQNSEFLKKNMGISKDIDESKVKEKFLVLAVGDKPLAVPLQFISRLEMLASHQIERSGDLDVIQYRDTILPLINLKKLISQDIVVDTDEADCAIVVVSNGTSSLGLVVKKIIDIVEDEFVHHNISSSGVISSTAVIRGMITEVVDVNATIRQYSPSIELPSQVM